MESQVREITITKIVINNVKEDKMHKGAYARIFRILNNDSIFTERYEADCSVGFVNGQYILHVEGTLDWSEEEPISKIKNVEIVGEFKSVEID